MVSSATMGGALNSRWVHKIKEEAGPSVLDRLDRFFQCGSGACWLTFAKVDSNSMTEVQRTIFVRERAFRKRFPMEKMTATMIGKTIKDTALPNA
jgi:hypothetical protein